MTSLSFNSTCLTVDGHDTSPAGPCGQAEEPVVDVVWAVGAHDVALDEAPLGEAAGHGRHRLAHVSERLHPAVRHVLDPR